MNENTQEKLDGLTKQEWLEKIQDFDAPINRVSATTDIIKTFNEFYIQIQMTGTADDEDMYKFFRNLYAQS